VKQIFYALRINGKVRAAEGRVLGVAASGYYAWRDRGPSKRAVANQNLLQDVRRIFSESGKALWRPQGSWGTQTPEGRQAVHRKTHERERFAIHYEKQVRISLSPTHSQRDFPPSFHRTNPSDSRRFAVFTE
jgi:hypothetical protein